MPVTDHPPGTPFPKGHPFANICISFVPGHRSASTPRRTAGLRNDEERKADEEAFRRFRQRLSRDVATSIKHPLVPQRERDLEDIAFELLRERYKGR